MAPNSSTTSNGSLQVPPTTKVASTNERPNETISSFPGVWKFPSYRNSYFGNALEWMSAKKDDDDIGEQHWRVHDKLYNLEAFIKIHPGGSDWISMTRGTDITEAFEVSHVMNKAMVERTLASYYVKESEVPRNSPYTFKEGGFYKTLQKRAEPVLKAVGSGPTTTMLIWQDSIAFLYLALLYTCAILSPTGIKEALSMTLTSVTSVVQLMVAYVATGLILGVCTTCAHNFCHLKKSWRKYYMDLTLLSSYEWRTGHNFSHHLFPNTILDYEVYLFEPVIEISWNRKRNWVQKYLAHFYLYGGYTQYFLAEWLKRLVLVVFKRKQALRAENLLIVAQFLASAYLTGSLLIPLVMLFIIQSAASFYMTFVGEVMAAHHHPDSFHEGDEVRADPDFGLCQLDVTQASVEAYTRNIFYAASTFSEHPLHHLFPTVCHSKLHYLQPVVNQMLAEYSEKIMELNTLQKLAGIHYVLPGKD